MRTLLTIFCLVALTTTFASAAEPMRVVCLGDSITDGHTYPLLVQQAIAEAKLPPPKMLNAGIGGDTAAGMQKRLVPDVLERKPDVVLLSAGVNDILQGKKLEDYLGSVSRIADELMARKIRLILLTITPLRGEERQARVDEWNAALKKLAMEKKLVVADVAAACAASAARGEDLLEKDGVHLSFAGYRAMTRGVLDALGYKDVAVPEKSNIELESGAITEWRIRAWPAGKEPSGEFTNYKLPESEPHDAWWFDQERQRGFAVYVGKRFGPRVEAMATIDRPKEDEAWLVPGADVRAIRLNGEKVYEAPPIHGWHLGPGVRVKLKAGMNEISLDAGQQFFLAVREEAE
jgi:lysophospholipase L1-like esterase